MNSFSFLHNKWHQQFKVLGTLLKQENLNKKDNRDIGIRPHQERDATRPNTCAQKIGKVITIPLTTITTLIMISHAVIGLVSCQRTLDQGNPRRMTYGLGSGRRKRGKTDGVGSRRAKRGLTKNVDDNSTK